MLGGQALPCIYLAHHPLQSVLIITIGSNTITIANVTSNDNVMTHLQGCSSCAQLQRCARFAWLPAARSLSAAMPSPSHTPAALPCHAAAPVQQCASVQPHTGSSSCKASHIIQSLGGTHEDTLCMHIFCIAPVHAVYLWLQTHPQTLYA